MNRIFAYIAGEDVFYITRIPSDHKAAERCYAGLSSNPKIIECTGFLVFPGYIYSNNNFYLPDDIEKTSPVVQELSDNNLTKSFALTVGEDVFGVIHVPPTLPTYELLCAGMRSNPIVAECTSVKNIDIGWRWDGQNFLSPI